MARIRFAPALLAAVLGIAGLAAGCSDGAEGSASADHSTEGGDAGPQDGCDGRDEDPGADEDGRPGRQGPRDRSGTSDDDPTPTTRAVPAGDDVSPLLEDLARTSDSAFRVDYRTAGGYLGSLTTWWKYPWGRADAVWDGIGGRVYANAETGDVTFCVTLRVGASDCDTDPGEGYPGLPPILNPATQEKELERALAVPGLDVSTRTIAGQEADCVTGDAPAGQTPTVICLARSGALLYFQETAAANPYTIEATAYSETVSDADVTP